MWLQLLMKLAQADPTKSKDIKKEDLAVLEKKYAEQAGSIFAQNVSFDIASSMDYFVENNDDGSIGDITVDSKKSAEQTLEQKSLTDTLKGLFSIEQIKKTVDVNSDGKIDDSEVKGFLSQVSGLDGDVKNISADDFANYLADLDVGLGEMINKAAQDILKDNVLVSEKVQEDSPVQKAQQSNSPRSTGNVSNGGSNHNHVNKSSNVQSAPPAAERTTDNIQKEIDSKESEKTSVNSEADTAIQTERENIDKAVAESMQKNQIKEEIKQEYEAEKSKLDTTISDQSKIITSQTTIIQNSQATISAKESAITSVTGQISSLNGQLGSIVDSGDPKKDEGNSAKRQEITEKINNLEQEKTNLESAKKTAEDAKKTAEDAKKAAEDTKQQAETDRSGLLQKYADKYPDSGMDKVKNETETIRKESEAKIETIKSEQQTKINDLDSGIQTLRTELAQVEQEEKTKTLIKDNSVSTFDANFDKMLGLVFGSEGGFVNNPNDKGGATNYGITEGTYRAYTGDPNADVSNITKEEAAKIYYENYYQASGAEEIAKSNPELSYAVFDASVNHGVGGAASLLEQSGGDVDKFMELRKEKYINIVANDPSQVVFQDGWQNRWNDVYAAIDPNHKYENYLG